MKRTVISLAAGAVFAAPLAHAEVTLSGNITAGPTYLHQASGSSGASNSIATTPTTGQQGITTTGIDTNYSNITISSLEDLGGGMNSTLRSRSLRRSRATCLCKTATVILA